jgi:cell division protein FtsB
LFAKFRPYLPTALLALLIFYFGVNALTGERGLLQGASREATLAEQTHKLRDLRAEREQLETEVRLLSDNSLSRDLLEEEARRMLGFAGPSDYVIRNQR